MNLRMLISILRYPGSFAKFKAFGSNIRLAANGLIANPAQMSLGNNIFIAKDFFISAHKLSIGNNVMIGPHLLLECENHQFDRVGCPMWDYRKDKVKGSVEIENDVWIGGNVTILKDVVIGEGAVIGAGSVVTKSVVPYTISVGNPCRAIRARFNEKDLVKHLAQTESKYTSLYIASLWKEASLI